MTELNPESLPDTGKDGKKFWDTFFHHLDKLETMGVLIDRDRIMEVAENTDMEGAKRLLFYSVLESQPNESSMSDVKAIINFLLECGYIDPDDNVPIEP